MNKIPLKPDLTLNHYSKYPFKTTTFSIPNNNSWNHNYNPFKCTK